MTQRAETDEAEDLVATAAAWAGVREREVAELITPADVRRAWAYERAAPLIVVLGAVLTRFRAAPPMKGHVNHPGMAVLLVMAAVLVLIALAALLGGHRALIPLMSSLPPLREGGLGREALAPFLMRDTSFRFRRAAGLATLVMLGQMVLLAFPSGQVHASAPPDLVALALVGLVAVYVILVRLDRDKLAADIASDIADRVEEVGA